jgi:TP901 family phage tail tape measure protein
MFKLAELFVTVGADQSGLNHALAGIKAKLEGFAKGSFSVVGGGFAAALGLGAVGAAAGIGLAIKAAGDMEAKIATLSKATDLEGMALASMKAGLMGLSTELKGISLDDLIDIATSGAKLGIATGDLLAYAKGIAKVASAMDDIPAGEIADQIGKLNTVFKLGVQGTMQFGSAIDKLADSGVSSASGILDVAQRIAGSAVVAKISAQETVSLAAALLDTGTRAELASGALLDFIASLNQVKGRKEMAKTLGMSLADFARLVETKPMVAIEKFLGALAKLDAMGQVKTLENMGMKGDVHPAEMMKLAQVAGTLGKYVNMANHEFVSLDQITKSYTASAGLAWSQLASFRNQVQILGDKVGSFLLPAFKRLTTGLAEAGVASGKFVEDNKPAFEAWGVWIEQKVGIGTSAIKNWQGALDVAREFAKEKVDNIKETFGWFADNLGPVMDRVANTIADGFAEGMRLAIEEIKAGVPTVSKVLKDAARGVVDPFGLLGPGAPDPSTLVPRKVPRPFTDLKLSTNPKLTEARDKFDAAKHADDLARQKAEFADIRAANLKKAEAGRAAYQAMIARRPGTGFDPRPGRNVADAGRVADALANMQTRASTEQGRAEQKRRDADMRTRMGVGDAVPGTSAGAIVPDKVGSFKVLSDQLKAQNLTNDRLATLIKNTGGNKMVPMFQ